MTNILDFIRTLWNSVVAVFGDMFETAAHLLSTPFGVVAFIAMSAFVASVLSVVVRASLAGRR